LLLYISAVMAAMRALDLALLLRWPKLLTAYLATWKSAYQKSPFAESSFEKVHAARRRGRSQVEFTYGETPVVTGRSIWRRLGVGPQSVVVDLGAGRGRVLIAARTLGAKATGYDLLEAHVDMTRAPLEKVGIEVVCEDAAKVELGDVTHVFLAWTCFTERSRRQVTEHLATLPSGASVVTLDYAIDSDAFETTDERKVWCSWGRATAFTHTRR
jgi:hypothetical protein